MYFVNFSLDIAIGTFMIWCFVRVQELTAVRFGIDSLKVDTWYIPKYGVGYFFGFHSLSRYSTYYSTLMPSSYYGFRSLKVSILRAICAFLRSLTFVTCLSEGVCCLRGSHSFSSRRGGVAEQFAESRGGVFCRNAGINTGTIAVCDPF